jgi:hypothetical protein
MKYNNKLSHTHLLNFAVVTAKSMHQEEEEPTLSPKQKVIQSN